MGTGEELPPLKTSSDHTLKSFHVLPLVDETSPAHVPCRQAPVSQN